MQISFLDIIRQCDSFHSTDSYILKYDDLIIGFVTTPVIDALRGCDGWEINDESRSVSFSPESSFESRCILVKKTVERWRDERRFEVLAKWRDELYSVFGPTHTVLFTIERSASPLFGVATFGVHVNGFVLNPLRVWVARRAKHKTYGGMLDNMVGGGIAHGYEVMETLIKESNEEAGLDRILVEARAQAAGIVSYMHVRDARAGGETGLFQPEYQYVYDMDMGDTRPQVNDDEVVGFELMTIDAIKSSLTADQWKTNAALVMIDFLVRRGLILPDEEPGYAEIVSRSHRPMCFPIR